MTILARSTLALAALGAILAEPARAHPHVWVTTSATVVYEPGGRITGIRQAWTFDEGYSAYATQGLEAGPDGKPTAEKLAELARINMESLPESNFFTVAKANGSKLAFGEPAEPRVALENGRMVLTFLLPFKTPAKADRAFSLEVYDPSFFVDFAIADGADAVRLEGAPKGCALNVSRPKPEVAETARSMSESFFSALSAAQNVGGQFSSRILVACP